MHGLDLKAFPALAAYLEPLPEGLASYPLATAKLDVVRDVRATIVPLRNDARVPAPIRACLGDDNARWIPEVVSASMCMLARDTQMQSDDAFLEWFRGNVGRLFQQPLYRVLMALVSPSLVALGAAKRWSTFHSGSELIAKALPSRDGRRQAELRLTTPPYLYHGLTARAVGASFYAALDASKAKGPRVDVEMVSPSEHRFAVSWEE